ncbi:uncharacterized protein CLUP02_01141 [Colletotrichum lupini]|uniref:Uncharacterized protein n=1 Tax=Colletotrichum lupini TaxID=145971 RepID=A0A9Q8SC54_9PEZI|nr:uncharacterized protein CLUP02_01141 [Colletotrichum lupini]UQC74490.1 hypothetical protein CLUP02_01141 [Colletotrichum lupini]
MVVLLAYQNTTHTQHAPCITAQRRGAHLSFKVPPARAPRHRSIAPIQSLCLDPLLSRLKRSQFRLGHYPTA